jgi:hypothetical protein
MQRLWAIGQNEPILTSDQSGKGLYELLDPPLDKNISFDERILDIEVRSATSVNNSSEVSRLTFDEWMAKKHALEAMRAKDKSSKWTLDLTTAQERGIQGATFMSSSRLLHDQISFVPEVLPVAPRPIAGELISSWPLRVSFANGFTLAQLVQRIEARFPEAPLPLCIGEILEGYRTWN